MTANNPDTETTQTDYREGVDRKGTGTGLDENVAGALCYLLGIITGVIFFVVEDENQFVRFHAAQSIVTFGAVFVVAMVFSVVSGVLTSVMFTGVGAGGFGLFGIFSLLLSLVWLVISLVSLGLWLFLMFQAYQGKRFRVPVAAGIADGLV